MFKQLYLKIRLILVKLGASFIETVEPNGGDSKGFSAQNGNK